MQENYIRFTVELHSYSNEELVELFNATQKEDYLKELMKKNSGIIRSIASSYSIPAHDMEDLMEVGYVALWDAVKHYDKERGYTFTSALKGFVRQQYNRLYDETHRAKRCNGESPVSLEELEEINKEHYSYDDYSNLFVEGFMKTLAGSTKKVAELLLDGVSKGDIAKVLGCTGATVSYYIKRLQKAYTEYAGGLA